ncbi:E-selectin-like [Kryptolebias marmoratus]|uniref:E-selectin-like n=1 Tax=Kryptolebias marmoratus TaxID=37003 RepID=UPI0018ACC262|nr:E-selectin-like [Kryptolebias marmoratus]
MDKTFFVILLITGFFATFDSFSYYFYSDVVTKAAAAKYCKQHHIDLLQEDVSFNRNKVFAQSTSWFVDYSKAWIGVNKAATMKIWVGSVYPKYYNWSAGEPDGGLTGLCVFMTDLGGWYEHNCSDLKRSVCSNVDKSNKRTVKLKIQTTANMEDLVVIASLEEQLGAMLSKQGVTGYRLTWKKLPAKKKDTP